MIPVFSSGLSGSKNVGLVEHVLKPGLLLIMAILAISMSFTPPAEPDSPALGAVIDFDSLPFG
jgi:hypothetical protein